MNAARASILALLVFWAASALAVVAVPPLVGRVVDQTGTLTSGDIASLNQTIRSFEARKGSQIAVLIVPTTDGEAIEQFSLRVAEAWKIGRKKIDDGAVLVIAKNDRHLRIEVGYGLEGALTDVTTKRIIDEEITPKFKSGDFAGGVSAGLNKMIRIIDGEKLPEPEPPHWQQQTGLFDVDAHVQSVPPDSGVPVRRVDADHARAAGRRGRRRRRGDADRLVPVRLAGRGDIRGADRGVFRAVQRRHRVVVAGEQWQRRLVRRQQRRLMVRRQFEQQLER